MKISLPLSPHLLFTLPQYIAAASILISEMSVHGLPMKLFQGNKCEI